ncbi:MAG: hypothetical protein LBE24_04220 [Methylobacillus sp.]|jgi:hypothetical protein|nr:hypothetical protein [Methylobacillus sp.]
MTTDDIHLPPLPQNRTREHVAWHRVENLLVAYAREAVLADRETHNRRQSGAEHTEAQFDLLFGDEVAASTFGERDKAFVEILNYMAAYSEDGEVRIEEVIRVPVSLGNLKVVPKDAA